MSGLPQRRVILDKSFLQGENSDSRRLLEMREAGAVFVLTDTLMHELGTDSNPYQWAAVQRKLFPVWDRIECWEHSADLLKREIAERIPLSTPVFARSTEFWRAQWRNGEVYVPDNLAETGQMTFAQREEDSVIALIDDCRSFWEARPDYAKIFHRGEKQFSSLLKDPEFGENFVRWWVIKDHGNPDDEELYIPGAETGLGPEWFAYHHAKANVSLCCHFISKYGLKDIPGVDFSHTYLDADYLLLLHYADALATNETSGSLASLKNWMLGDSKIMFSTKAFDSACPLEEDIRIEAYFKWNREGRTHGHDTDDWIWAKSFLRWKNLDLDSCQTH